MEAKVADMTNPNGGWKWSVLAQCFDEEILEHIAACPPPMEDLGDDVCLWKNNDS
ncbi:hypothetical protein Gorai_014364, partial [Gossypium raimondii]|nr:hypothetical protein [Gossypium raimondii]